jgi:hypothetical protein
VLYIYWNYIFFIILQENIDTVRVERVENVGEEDCVKIKTEEDWIQLVRTIKSEEEVSVCWCVLCSDLFISVCACVFCVHCTLILLAYHMF